MKKKIAKYVYWTATALGYLIQFLMIGGYVAFLIYGAIYDPKHFWPAVGIVAGACVLAFCFGFIRAWSKANKEN